jgi:hypothetical protein
MKHTTTAKLPAGYRVAYTAARDSFIKELATMLRGNVGVADLDGDGLSVKSISPGTRH